MSPDVIEQLRQANPVPGEMPALPIDEVLMSIEYTPRAHRRTRRLPGYLAAAVSVAVVLGVAAIVLATGSSKHPTPTLLPRIVPTGQELNAFTRPQTARDRMLAALLRRSARLGHQPKSVVSAALAGTIPRLTRYITTLPDGREVFLVAIRDGYGLPKNLSRPNGGRIIFPAGSYRTRIIVVSPSGRRIGGQPIVMVNSGPETNQIAYRDALTTNDECGLTLHWTMEPNNVSRIAWVFPRQDRYGFVFKGPLTVNVPVIDNVAIAEINSRASCDEPSLVTLYGANGQVLGRAGSSRNLYRIKRPIRRGNPLAGPKYLGNLN